MERRVKERLIGASILVVLLVLIVPELLSGPPKKPPPPAAAVLPVPSGPASDPVRNVTVDLNTSKPTQAEPEPAPETVPASESPAVPDGAPAATVPHPMQVPQVPQASQVAPPAAPVAHPSLDSLRPSPTSAPPPGGWAVQLGSFANRDNAENLVRQLKALGYGAYTAPQGAGRSQRFRVRVGGLADKAAAERSAAHLKAQGHAGSIVTPGH